MQKRYDLRRSDNYMYTGRVSYVCSGDGSLFVYTGFPVTSATVAWAVYPFAQDEEMSSSSSSSGTSSSSSSQLDVSSSSESSQTEVVSGLPRIYVASYSENGFTVSYENIPVQIGYIEFSFNVV